jgi:hypothetical protein
VFLWKLLDSTGEFGMPSDAPSLAEGLIKSNFWLDCLLKGREGCFILMRKLTGVVSLFSLLSCPFTGKESAVYSQGQSPHSPWKMGVDS